MSAKLVYARPANGSDVRPKIRPLRLFLSWLVAAAPLFIAAWIVPGVEVQTIRGALGVALVIAILNAILPPIVAALRLPFTLVLPRWLPMKPAAPVMRTLMPPPR